jgi:hypothetical protein
MKTTLTLLTTLLLAPLLTPLTALHAASAKQPNVLLIITDDQGYGDFSIHGNTHLQTPHIDRLAADGVRFDRFYVNSFAHRLARLCSQAVGRCARGAMR